MRALLLSLLLLPSYASAAELECEPNARVILLSRWVRASVVRLEGSLNWELPWSGKESITTGVQLRAERLREMETTEQAQADELLSSVPEETRFVTFRQKGNGQNPLAHILYVDQDLLKGGEGDGLVIAMQQNRLEITSTRVETSAKVFHCRSR